MSHVVKAALLDRGKAAESFAAHFSAGLMQFLLDVMP